MRLGEIIELWRGNPGALTPRRAVLVGFPQDEGVRRNHGRPGAADAPDQIRHWLYRLTICDWEKNIDLARQPPLDLGNVRIQGSLEDTQHRLGEIVATALSAGAVPIVLGGGHETAYGHYLGYARSQRRVAIVNLDAHLDVRPCIDGHGHSGSPFRQAYDHPTQPLQNGHYACLGVQPHAVSRQHWRYVLDRAGIIGSSDGVCHSLSSHFERAVTSFANSADDVYVSLDSDVAAAADVPGVSAPNPTGLSGRELAACARLAGRIPQVSSFDLVELNPRYDVDGRSLRWGALVIWNFLIGLAGGRPDIVGITPEKKEKR
jgi:formiminoglutamase